MREMNLEELHEFCLEIAKDIHRFCVENGVRYSLGYGSLIGAVRHKGYIPWDDDMDILMPRPDFDFFCEHFSSTKFKLATHKNAYIAYARVYDNSRTYCRTLGRWLKYEREGVFVDIFPMDAVSSDITVFNQQRDQAKKILKLQLDNRGAKKAIIDLFRILPFKEALESLKVTLHNRYNYEGETNLDEINRRYQELLYENDWKSADYCAVLAYVNDSISKQVPVKFWNHLVLTDFEDTKFYIFSSYDKVLKDIYGDYMKLPSKEKREQHALAIAKFYFK